MAACAHSLLLSLIIALSLSSIHSSSAARHLLQAQPAIPFPSLPKVALPPLPAMPTLPKAALPPLPTTPLPTATPTFPKPTLPPLPSTAPIPAIPTLPKVTLPPLPAVTSLPTIPSMPTIPTAFPAIPLFSPPPSTTSP